MELLAEIIKVSWFKKTEEFAFAIAFVRWNKRNNQQRQSKNGRATSSSNETNKTVLRKTRIQNFTII